VERQCSGGASPSTNGDVRGLTTEISLSGDDLVIVVGSQLHPCGSPRAEVVARGDSAAAVVRLADGPELVERRRPVDGGLVDALGLVDVLHRSVRGDSSFKVAPVEGL
jgi:hypothetical protein